MFRGEEHDRPAGQETHRKKYGGKKDPGGQQPYGVHDIVLTVYYPLEI